MPSKTNHKNEGQIIRNSYAKECFQDVADRDYISARANFRLGLLDQFLWCSLQAVEKYLKAILLYNGRDTRKLHHNLHKALQRVQNISDIAFDFSQPVLDFIQYLNKYGENRYLELSSYTYGDELFKLDMTVWELRRYCQYIRGTIIGARGEEISLLDPSLRSIQLPFFRKNPHKLRLVGGFLEEVLRKPQRHPLRVALTWCNFYYGQRKKKRIKKFKMRSYSVIPPHYRHPEWYKELKDYVYFSGKVQEEIKRLSSTSGEMRAWFAAHHSSTSR